jgi:2-polyprenyl-3-methyl-5-hydroxy-6-metoxy-1,4-benzoquinol methylase
VLEIGCGTGSLALAMAPFAGHIHALDVSAEMIRIANAKKAAAGVGNVTFHTGTLEEPLPVGPGQVDSAWAYSILHLVPDSARTLQTLFQLLAPGGTLVSSNVVLGGSWVPYRPLLTVMRWLGKAPAVHVQDRATITREMHAVGFVEVEEKDVGADPEIAFIVARKPTGRSS